MAKPQVEALLKQAEELEKALESVTGTEVPKSLKEARETAWELAPAAIEVGWLVHYPREQRGLDKTRVMRLDRALEIMEAYEESLVQRHVKDPSQVMFRKLRRAKAAAMFIKENAGLLWDAVNEVFENYHNFIDIILDLPNLIARVIDALISVSLRTIIQILTMLVAASSIGVLNLAIVDVMKSRDEMAAKMRKAAFPQRHGKRYRRRKVARL